jgi:hypothetical protein
MLCDDGFTAAVYHAGDEVSKGVPVHRDQPLSQDHDWGELHTITSGLSAYDLDQYVFPPPAVETAGPGRTTGLKRSAPRCQRPRRAQSSRRGGHWSPRPQPRAPSRATVRVAFRFRCAPALYPRSGQDRGWPTASLAGAAVLVLIDGPWGTRIDHTKNQEITLRLRYLK